MVGGEMALVGVGWRWLALVLCTSKRSASPGSSCPITEPSADSTSSCAGGVQKPSSSREPWREPNTQTHAIVSSATHIHHIHHVSVLSSGCPLPALWLRCSRRLPAACLLSFSSYLPTSALSSAVLLLPLLMPLYYPAPPRCSLPQLRGCPSLLSPSPCQLPCPLAPASPRLSSCPRQPTQSLPAPTRADAHQLLCQLDVVPVGAGRPALPPGPAHVPDPTHTHQPRRRVVRVDRVHVVGIHLHFEIMTPRPLGSRAAAGHRRG